MWKAVFWLFFFFKASKCKLSPHMPNQRLGVTVRLAATPDGEFTGPFSNSHLLPWQDSHTAYTLTCVSISEEVGGCIRIPPPLPAPTSGARLRALIFTEHPLLCWRGWSPLLAVLWDGATPQLTDSKRKLRGIYWVTFPISELVDEGNRTLTQVCLQTKAEPSASSLSTPRKQKERAAGHKPPASHFNLEKTFKRSSLWY